MIDFEHASYSYSDGNVFSDVTLSISSGGFYFLTGPSGSGKTTFLKICYGALIPTSGTVRLFGERLENISRDNIARIRRRVGVIHQDCQFIDHMQVLENILLPLTVSRRDGRVGRVNLEELLRWVGLKSRANAFPPELSGGERQRAALARAVIMSPEIIIADEPTGNIDMEMSLRLLQLLIELNRMGKTILFATHDLSLIRQVKKQVQARVLRIFGYRISLAGTDL